METRLYWSIKETAAMLAMTEQMVYYYARKCRHKVKAHHPGMFSYQEMEYIRAETFNVRRGSKIHISKVMAGLGYVE